MVNFKNYAVLMSSVIMLSATPLFADTYNMTGTVVDVKPNYRNTSVPVTVQDCRDVEVPVYGTQQQQGNAAEGAILGMILGGLIGKGATGNDKGAAAGAIMGGVIGADKGSKPKDQQVIVGYRNERQCSNRTVYETQQKLSDYTVTYEILGVTQTATVSQKYQIGGTIPVQVNIGLR